MTDLAGIDAVWRASLGDLTKLAERLRDGKSTREELNLAADLILGKLKRPAHRTQTLKTWLRDVQVYDGVNFLVNVLDWKKEAAVAWAMEEVHLKKSGVRDVMKKVKDRRSKIRARQTHK